MLFYQENLSSGHVENTASQVEDFTAETVDCSANQPLQYPWGVWATSRCR